MNESQRPKVLAVDDEQSSLNAIFRTLRREFDVVLSLNGYSALEVLRREHVDVILADQRMPEMTGVSLFQQALEIQPDTTRVMITGYTDIEAIVQAINDGKVFYYINKPWEPEDLRLVIQRAVDQTRLIRENNRLMQELATANQRLSAENTVLHREARKQYTFEHIIGQSPAMQQVFRMLEKVIPTDTTVLLLGETGTGKELIAKAIHFNGPRKDKMFVAQNCGAMPDSLLESELFGHVKGAFTGATGDKKGLFEIADGGTIFLDEIADTSPAMQQRLLRALQEGEIHPVGSEKTINVDVRVVSAANRDLLAAIETGEFRKDLYYRLNVFPVRIPPLRERREDIPLLARYFLEKFAIKLGKSGLQFSNEAIARLMSGDYPGNVRQLENLVERAVTLADASGIISPDLLASQIDMFEGNGAQPAVSPGNDQSLKDIVEQMEAFYIREAMESHSGNITKVAQQLGLSRLGLHKKLQRYQIDSTIYKQSKQ
ncbi:MAG: sigma-54-dependent Fis family transcriptional regulator [Calditrichaeota bacterium]|nr:sigma-54-dependent Fis family transcriptional regulator [Calditrichota bacterium]MCB0298792.1 sigma-54-dependent Fis family transcriptional regulator [Calditrichota bacterium]MCB9068243.1 sigma-54-dependent Fis family transcriptional regulator [Calditrichia bacterium]